MPVPNLSDGTPLTYEWLNEVADTINELYIMNKDDSNVRFVGDVSGQDIQVVTDSVKISINGDKINGSKIVKENIKFPKPFANKNTVVVAMVTSTAAKHHNNPIPAGVAVGQITETNFDAVIQLFNEESKFGKVSFELKYVAIGKRQATQ